MCEQQQAPHLAGPGYPGPLKPGLGGTGRGWGLFLKRSRRKVYDGIGLGAYAASQVGLSASRRPS